MFEIEKKKKKSVAYEAKWDSNIAAFPQFYHLLCGSWISEGLVVWAEGGGERTCSACMSCQRIR